jgi:hypothetical protein
MGRELILIRLERVVQGAGRAKVPGRPSGIAGRDGDNPGIAVAAVLGPDGHERITPRGDRKERVTIACESHADLHVGMVDDPEFRADVPTRGDGGRLESQDEFEVGRVDIPGLQWVVAGPDDSARERNEGQGDGTYRHWNLRCSIRCEISYLAYPWSVTEDL